MLKVLLDEEYGNRYYMCFFRTMLEFDKKWESGFSLPISNWLVIDDDAQLERHIARQQAQEYVVIPIDHFNVDMAAAAADVIINLEDGTMKKK